MKRYISWRSGALLCAACIALVSAPALAQTTYTVTSNSGQVATPYVAGSLAEAISLAVNGDTIVFDPTVTSIDTLGRINMNSAKAITIDGDLGGGNRVIIRRATTFTNSQLFYTGRGFQIRNVDFDQTGRGAAYGLLISGVTTDTAAPTVIENCNFTSPAAAPNQYVNLLYNSGSSTDVQFLNCTFSDPDATQKHLPIMFQAPHATNAGAVSALTVDGCEFRGFGGRMIDMYSFAGTNGNFKVSSITITNNVFEGRGRATDATSSAIWLEYPNMSGVGTSLVETVSIPITVTGNKIFKTRYGIVLNDFIEAALIQDNDIGPLEAGGAPATTDDWLQTGIQINGYARDIQVGGTGASEGNVIKYCTTSGVELGDNATWGPADNIKVVGNDIDHIDSYDGAAWAGTGQAIRIRTTTSAGATRTTLRPSDPTIPFALGGCTKPTIDTLNTTTVAGTAPANATVYVYWGLEPAAGGTPYAAETGVVLPAANLLGSTVANSSGAWTLSTNLSTHTTHRILAYAVNPTGTDRLTYPENTSEITARPYTGTTGDVDEDGLPDALETYWGLDIHDANGVNSASGDYDGDGFTNQQELANGLADPKNVLSTPVTPGPNGENLPVAGLAGLAMTAAALVAAAIRRRRS